jgi:Uma2 family endonuclease
VFLAGSMVGCAARGYNICVSTQPQTPPRMSVDEFLAWAEGRPGRYELVAGEVVAQAAERAAHWRTKLATHVALLAAVRAKALPCHVVPDGASVRIDDATVYEPDAMVYSGSEAPPSAMLVDNPVIIVEILSPSTGRRDRRRKLADYFRLPSVAHYLIIDPDEVLVIHHRRRGDDILTRILREGAIVLDPPGFEIAVKEIYGAERSIG